MRCGTGDVLLLRIEITSQPGTNGTREDKIMDIKRQRRHMMNGDGRVFIPLWRMRQIKWEEAVVRSRHSRELANKTSRNVPDEDITIRHMNCGCGSMECQGVPIDATPRHRRGKTK